MNRSSREAAIAKKHSFTDEEGELFRAPPDDEINVTLSLTCIETTVEQLTDAVLKLKA